MCTVTMAQPWLFYFGMALFAFVFGSYLILVRRSGVRLSRAAYWRDVAFTVSFPIYIGIFLVIRSSAQ
jgi:hypothetical protein